MMMGGFWSDADMVNDRCKAVYTVALLVAVRSAVAVESDASKAKLDVLIHPRFCDPSVNVTTTDATNGARIPSMMLTLCCSSFKMRTMKL